MIAKVSVPTLTIYGASEALHRSHQLRRDGSRDQWLKSSACSNRLSAWDVKRATTPSACPAKTVWTRLADFFNPPQPEVCAVCIPPGARLRLEDMPMRLQQEYSVGPVEEVTFTQISALANSYRDATATDWTDLFVRDNAGEFLVFQNQQGHSFAAPVAWMDYAGKPNPTPWNDATNGATVQLATIGGRALVVAAFANGIT